jgi:transposase-like protein
MRFSEEEKGMWVEDWRRSGKSAWAYAKENGLNRQTFVRWTKSVTEEKTCFVEVHAQMPVVTANMPEILIEKGDVKIHIPLMINRGELKAIMEGLGVSL